MQHNNYVKLISALDVIKLGSLEWGWNDGDRKRVEILEWWGHHLKVNVEFEQTPEGRERMEHSEI